jgi:hypothetical protein
MVPAGWWSGRKAWGRGCRRSGQALADAGAGGVGGRGRPLADADADAGVVGAGARVVLPVWCSGWAPWGHGWCWRVLVGAGDHAARVEGPNGVGWPEAGACGRGWCRRGGGLAGRRGWCRRMGGRAGACGRGWCRRGRVGRGGDAGSAGGVGGRGRRRGWCRRGGVGRGGCSGARLVQAGGWSGQALADAGRADGSGGLAGRRGWCRGGCLGTRLVPTGVVGGRCTDAHERLARPGETFGGCFAIDRAEGAWGNENDGGTGVAADCAAAAG